jgi:hypothetical protein
LQAMCRQIERAIVEFSKLGSADDADKFAW